MNSLQRYPHRYRVCGLHIASAIPFPELRAEPASAQETAPDIEFDIGGDLRDWAPGTIVMAWDEPAGTPWMICTKSDGGYCFHYPGYADILVDHFGRHVRCVAKPGTAPETIRHLFLDQVIPPVLNLRGREALHASAVGTPNGACAFLGASGGGKSTLAAAFHALGFPVICDDCLLLKLDPDQVLVEPAYPGLRLWDDSRSVLLGNARSTQPVSQFTSKRRVATPESDNEGAGSLPLRGIYALQPDAGREHLKHPVIEPVSVRDAFMALIEYSFRLDLSDRAMILRQMQVLERVAREIPVKRLLLPRDLEALPAARALILQDLQRK